MTGVGAAVAGEMAAAGVGATGAGGDGCGFRRCAGRWRRRRRWVLSSGEWQEDEGVALALMHASDVVGVQKKRTGENKAKRNHSWLRIAADGCCRAVGVREMEAGEQADGLRRLIRAILALDHALKPQGMNHTR